MCSAVLLLCLLQASPFSADVATSVRSGYTVRGLNLAPAGFQSEAILSYQVAPRLTASAWWFNYSSFQRGFRVPETDYSAILNYRAPFAHDLTRWTLGYVYFDFNNDLASPAFQGASDTQEVFGGVTFNVPGRPALFAFYKFANRIGTYLRFSGGHAWQLAKSPWTASVDGAVGFDFNRIDGFQNGYIRTALDYAVTPTLKVGPAVDWWFPSANVDPAANGFRPVWSLGLSWSDSF